MVQEGVSFAPSEMLEGGLFEGNAQVVQHRFVEWDYGDPKRNLKTLASRMSLVDDGGNEHIQYWSAGSLDDFAPSADGLMILSQGGLKAVRKSTNYSHMITELVTKAGFPENKLTNKASCLEGLYAYWTHGPAPSRPGLNQEPRKDAQGRDRAPTVMVATHIHSLPGEATKHPTQGKILRSAAQMEGQAQGQMPGQGNEMLLASSTANTVAPQPVADSGDVEDTAIAYLLRSLTNGAVARADLSKGVFKDTVLATYPNKSKVATLVYDEAFLKRMEGMGMVKVEGNKVAAA